MARFDDYATKYQTIRMPADTSERVHLSVAEARALSERAMRGIGYEPEEARILADHVIDAALCGYEYSGLPKLLNVADHPLFKLEDYRRALAAEIAAIKATPRQDGVDEIRIPGERAYRDRARLAREGLEIDRRIRDALIQLAEGWRGA